MSFMLNAGPVPLAELGDALDTAAADLFGANPALDTPENAAYITAVMSMIGQFAAPGEWAVQVQGHANSGHEPEFGWSDSHLSVALTQSWPPPVDDAPVETPADAVDGPVVVTGEAPATEA